MPKQAGGYKRMKRKKKNIQNQEVFENRTIPVVFRPEKISPDLQSVILFAVL